MGGNHGGRRVIRGRGVARFVRSVAGGVVWRGRSYCLDRGNLDRGPGYVY